MCRLLRSLALEAAPYDIRLYLLTQYPLKMLHVLRESDCELEAFAPLNWLEFSDNRGVL